MRYVCTVILICGLFMGQAGAEKWMDLMSRHAKLRRDIDRMIERLGE